MKLPIFFIPAISTILLLAQCRSEQQPANSSSGIPKPEVFLYVVEVDNLRLRDQPGQSSQVVTQLKQGTVVEGLGIESDLQDEVELRGISVRAPYLQVTALAGDKPKGWAFGGALTHLYAGTRADMPDTERIAAFAAYLKTLDHKILNSGGMAWQYAEENFSDVSQPSADAAFVLLERFLRRMGTIGELYKLTENLTFSESEAEAIYQHKFDHSQNPVTTNLLVNGFRIATSEGMYFPITDWNHLQDFFGPRTTASMQKFINQRTAESRNTMFDDGGIVIPLIYLADVAVFWEKFNRENPYFPYHAEARESERWLRLVLVNGADNTPVFSYETNMVSEDFKSVWDYIGQRFPKTELAKRTKEMAEVCAAEGWKHTERVDMLRAKMAEDY